jgi:hypothetical protein
VTIGEPRPWWCRWSVEVYRDRQPPESAQLINRHWFATRRAAARVADRYRAHPYLSAFPRGPHRIIRRRDRHSWPSAI